MNPSSMAENKQRQHHREGETTSRLATLAATALTLDNRDDKTSPSSHRAHNKPNTDHNLPPPPTPYPFTWWCHECGSSYPLGATRRCLRCGHQFCTAPVRNRRRGETRGPCSAEFDYRGWAAWGAYKRSAAAARQGQGDDVVNGVSPSRKRKRTPGNPEHDIFAKWELTATEEKTPKRRKHSDGRRPSSSRTSEWRPLPEEECDEVSSPKEAMYIRGEHNCWRHCDFPSECFHTICSAWFGGRIPARTSRASEPSSSLSSVSCSSNLSEVSLEEEEEGPGCEREESRVQETSTASGGQRRSTRAVKGSGVRNHRRPRRADKEDKDDDSDGTSEWLPSSASNSESSNDSDSDYYDDDESSSDSN